MDDFSGAESQSAWEVIDGIGRYRWVWRVLAVLFCIPALFFMDGPEKRFKAARESGDIEAARKAVSSMRTAALTGVPIGIMILIFHFMPDPYYY